jgi:hypothetical protein
VFRTSRAAALAVAGLAVASTGRAEDAPPPTTQGQYSPYEQETIRIALEAWKATPEPDPEGKTLEAIEVVSLEVFEKRDPIPRFLNVFHATTRPFVIARESLITRGEPYRQVMVDETARNLRRLPQLSLVIPLAVKGSAPDKVRLLLVTKDVWSLRLNWDLGYGPGGLERLVLSPTESNLAGTHQVISLGYLYLPLSSTAGVSYTEPRLAGTRLAFASNINVVFSNKTGQPEGTIGGISVARPLFSAREEWAYGIGTSWSDSVLRRYVDAQLAAFVAKDLPAPNTVPYEYRGRLVTESAYVTRSFGWAMKNDFTLGAEINKREYLLGDVSAFNPAAVDEFVRTRVPVSDTRVGPYVQWRGYRTEFLRVLDFESLGLQEDYRLGHDLWLRVYPVTKPLGSSRDFLGAYAAAQYTLPISDGLVRGSVESTTEAEVSRLSDASVAANVRFVSPRTVAGRVVFDGGFVNRYRNYLNRLTFLGGDTRLRGYPSSFLVGKDALTYSLEFRSRPLELLSCQVGGVAFYDGGNALDGMDHLLSPRNSLEGIHHTVGAGARFLFPQFDRIVFRADVGVPVGPTPAGVNPVGFYVTFGQAFPLTTVGGSVASGGATSSVGGALGQ